MRKKEADKLLQKVGSLEASESALSQQVDCLKAENNALRQQFSGIGKLMQESNVSFDSVDGELKSAAAKLREQDILIQEFRNKSAAAEEFTEELFQKLRAVISEKRASEAALTSKAKLQEKNNEAIKDLEKMLSNAQESIQQQVIESVVNSCVVDALFAATYTEKEKRVAELSLVLNEFCLQQRKESEQLSCKGTLSSSGLALTHSGNTERTDEGKTEAGIFARFMAFWSMMWSFCGKALCCL